MQSDGTAGSAPAQTARYGIRYEGHDIEVVVRGGELAADRVQVLVDGDDVDRAEISTRAHDLGFTTSEGVEIRLHLGGRSLDALVRMRLRRADGYWVDLRQRTD